MRGWLLDEVLGPVELQRLYRIEYVPSPYGVTPTTVALSLTGFAIR